MNSLATNMVLERHGNILEDAFWLHLTNGGQHINLTELDTTVKGLNLALQLQARTVHLHTDSVCIYHWLTDVLTGRARVKTKATSKMLVQRRLMILLQLICEYGLQVDVTFVVSDQNWADELTQVPKKWLELIKHQSDVHCGPVGKGKNRSGKQLVSAWYGHNPLQWLWILDLDQLWADTFHCVAPGRNGHCPHAIFVIMRSAASVVKIGVKIATHLSANVSTYAPHARFIFLDW